MRRPGGGRRPLTETDPGLLAALEALVDPVTRGDPESPLRWTCKSTRRLAEELTRQGHRVGPRTVAALLHEAGYSLQANRKTREGLAHPDRNAQFEYINASVARSLLAGPAGDLGRHEEEGIGRRFQERRPGVAAARGTRGGPRPRLPGQDLGQGDPLRRLRHGQQPGLGQRRHRPRHGAVRGQQHPPLVARDGPAPLPQGQASC